MRLVKRGSIQNCMSRTLGCKYWRDPQFDRDGFRAWQLPLPTSRPYHFSSEQVRVWKRGTFLEANTPTIPGLVTCGLPRCDPRLFARATCQSYYPVPVSIRPGGSADFLIEFEFPGSDLNQVAQIGKKFAEQIASRVVEPSRAKPLGPNGPEGSY